MATATETGDKTEKTGVQGGEPPAPPPDKQEPAKAEPPAKAAPALDKQEPAKAEPPAKQEPKGAKAIGDNEDLPEDDDLIQLTSSAMKKRLQRATDKQLKDRFGTTDVDSIKARLDKLDAFEKKEEEQRRAALAKEERLEEDRKKAEERADAAERALAMSKNERVVDKEEGRLKDMAGEFVKPKFWKHVARDLAEHLRDNYTAEQLKTLGDGALKKWFGGYIKENPEYAKEEQKPEARTEKLSNGAKDNERPSQKGAPDMATKTFKPGQPNSMSRAEMAKLGINY